MHPKLFGKLSEKLRSKKRARAQTPERKKRRPRESSKKVTGLRGESERDGERGGRRPRRERADGSTTLLRTSAVAVVVWLAPDFYLFLMRRLASALTSTTLFLPSPVRLLAPRTDPCIFFSSLFHYYPWRGTTRGEPVRV